MPVCWSIDELPDPRKIKEIDCEFRKRLTPNRSQDYWWKYKGGMLSNTTKSARNLIQTYQTVGEPELQKIKTVEDILGMLSITDIESSNFIHVFGGIIPVRGALTMARIYKHIGENEKSAEFARAGLKVLGSASTLKPELEKLANAT